MAYLIGYLDINLSIPQKHQLIGHVTILEDDGAFSISFDFQMADDFIDDVVIQLSQIVNVSNHQLSEIHLFIFVLLDLVFELLGNMWKVQLDLFNIFFVEVCTVGVIV